jgi:hypothetical protein
MAEYRANERRACELMGIPRMSCRFHRSRDYLFLRESWSGWHAALGAMGAEYLYRSVTSGFYERSPNTSVKSSLSGKARAVR